MKAFLLFLILGGAALYTFLVVTHDSLQDGKTESTLAVQTQPNQPVAKQVSSWGTYLTQKPKLRWLIKPLHCLLSRALAKIWSDCPAQTISWPHQRIKQRPPKATTPKQTRLS